MPGRNQNQKIMPKVDLDKITLGHSPLTGSIFAGTPLRMGVWRHKKDVTNDFLACVIHRFEGKSEVIEDDENKWEITVKKLPCTTKKNGKNSVKK